MKKIIFLYFIFNGLFFFSQKKNPTTGTTPTIQTLVNTLQHDTCLNKKFSIVFYVVLDSGQIPSVLPGPGNATPGNLNNLVNNLNTAFKRICVQFLNCSTVYIPHYPFNQWTKNVVDPIVTSNWYTDKTINVYLVDQVLGQPANELLGYAYAPPTTTSTPSKDVIVLTKSTLTGTSTSGLQDHVALHFFGHFFGLPNTFDEIGSPIIPAPPATVISYEFSNATNCYAHGDGFCDTEADPYPLLFPPPNIYSTCGYYKQVGVQDGNGQYYNPPIDNIMSNWGCRCRFTQEQYNFMAQTILTKRLYLH